jgi:hypothetical protein
MKNNLKEEEGSQEAVPMAAHHFNHFGIVQTLIVLSIVLLIVNYSVLILLTAHLMFGAQLIFAMIQQSKLNSVYYFTGIEHPYI